MFVAPCLWREEVDCTGFAPISAEKVKAICSQAIARIESIQQEKTEKFIESERQRANRRRRFWSWLVKYQEKTTEEVKADLDYRLKHGSVSDCISLMGHYPQDSTSETWKVKAQELLALTKDSRKVYVNASDWEVIVRFVRK